jgi:Uma2 family endonuclease
MAVVMTYHYDPEMEDPNVEYPDGDGLPVAENDLARDCLLYAVDVLEIYFQANPEVYVSGNSFIYYERGNPGAVVSPDVYVVLGVPNHKRSSFKVWEEQNKTPSFVLEITSKTTKSVDQGSKKGLYAYLGVQEYFQFDPSGEYLDPPLQGLRLVQDVYAPLPLTTLADGSLSLITEVLHLELRAHGREIRFYDLATGERLSSHRETEQARQEQIRQTEQERQRAEQEQRRAEQERQRAEQEQLRAEQERQRAEQERQRAEDLAVQLARYRRLFGDLPE